MIRTDDMLNGDGLRVVIFVSGCNHHCSGCHNPQTWDSDSGEKFTQETYEKIIEELDKGYISGITLSGGDPLYDENLDDVYNLIKQIKSEYPNKTIWLYTGYTWEQIFAANAEPLRRKIVELCDVLCDGEFFEKLADVNYPWVGSTNQRVIDVKRSTMSNKIILH